MPGNCRYFFAIGFTFFQGDRHIVEFLSPVAIPSAEVSTDKEIQFLRNGTNLAGLTGNTGIFFSGRGL